MNVHDIEDVRRHYTHIMGLIRDGKTGGDTKDLIEMYLSASYQFQRERYETAEQYGRESSGTRNNYDSERYRKNQMEAISERDESIRLTSEISRYRYFMNVSSCLKIIGRLMILHEGEPGLRIPGTLLMSQTLAFTGNSGRQRSGCPAAANKRWGTADRTPSACISS